MSNPAATVARAETPSPATVAADYLGRVLKARVYDVAVESPLERAPRLSKRLGALVLLKREDQQPVFSFKLRGAFNKIASLDAEARARGVICASAGNHAQGVALAARRLGLRAVIVMPTTTPRIKTQAVADLGAEIVLHGDDFDAAHAHARDLECAQGLSFVHPFDDPEVIAGQGTIAMEILRQRHGEEIGCIVVPVGGGGLIAGVAAYAKALYPHIRIIGVESEDAPTLHHALAAGRPLRLPRVGVFADGTAVRQVGNETFRVAQALVDEVVLVSTDEICAAIQDIFEDTRVVAEPSGALAVAGLKRWLQNNNCGERACVAVVSGANMNFDRLRHVAERADLGADREMLLAVTIPEQQGSFKRFCQLIGTRAVTEFNYRYCDAGVAHIFVGLAIDPGSDDRAEVVHAIRAAGLKVEDLSRNEMAKLHVRYMVGGKAAQISDERLFRFEFPERRGALLKFLDAIGTDWNISLFHYRNHGSDHGRVLAGIQVPTDTASAFAQHLADLGYPHAEETGNPAYRAFL